jgi:hypothetical protein
MKCFAKDFDATQVIDSKLNDGMRAMEDNPAW